MTRTLGEASRTSRAHGDVPRLGFLGVGWIGAARLRALCESGACRAAALADVDGGTLEKARECAAGAEACGGLDELLAMELDGIVIATPSAMHADQAMRALQAGCAVFCQKPLARTEEETARVVEAARAADRLLGVDLSYRHTRAFEAVRDRIRAGDLGEVFAVELTFHNAYGPEKAWFRDVALSGGGCVIDLGIHLVDLALLALGWPRISRAEADLYARGERLGPAPDVVEDFADARLLTERGQSVRLACSWNLHAGRDAVIGARFYGTRGSAGFENRGGSFYDFEATFDVGTRREVIASPPDDWGGRAAVAWARRLARDRGFDDAATRLVEVASVLDRIYGR